MESGNSKAIGLFRTKLKKYESVLSGLNQFQIGSFRLNGNSLDVTSIPLHGFHSEYRMNGYYISATYGIEGRAIHNLPGYIQNKQITLDGRMVTQLKGGIGVSEKSHCYLSLTHISTRNSNVDSLIGHLPRENVVVTLDSRYLIKNYFFIDFLFGVSNSENGRLEGFKSLMQHLYDNNGDNSISRRLASIAKVGWRDEHGNSEWSAGFQGIGDLYETMGNPFLLKNRRALRIEGKQRFFKQCLQLKGIYVYGFSNSSSLYPSVNQEQISGEASLRLDRRGSKVWAKYSPNLFLQTASGIKNAVYQLNLASAGVQIRYKPTRRGQWSTMIQITNYADHSTYGDTSTMSGLWYLMAFQSYTSGKYNITFLNNTGVDRRNPGIIKDMTEDVSQTFFMKKIQLSQGVQIVKHVYDKGLFAGGSAAIKMQGTQRLKFGLSMTYLFSLNAGLKNQYFLNSTASWQF
jgi:hypothetical protein